jgi:hypothetical protein
MADTRIPLNVEQVDPISPLLLLTQRQRQNKLDKQQDEDRQRQIEREGIHDAQTLESLNQQSQVRDAQLSNAEIQGKSANLDLRRQALQVIASDGIAFNDLVQSGNIQGAAILGQELKRTMQTIGASTDEIDNILSMLGKDQAGAKAATAKAVEALTPHLPKIFEDIEDDQGNIVGQRNKETNQLSSAPSSLNPGNQSSQLDSYIKELQAARLGQQIKGDQVRTAATAAKTAADKEENDNRASQIQTEAQRAFDLTSKMLNNLSGLEGASGPISSRLPSFRQGTLDFESDMKELENLLTLGNLGRMTGVLSETDIRILANAASGLDAGGSEERMLNKLMEIQGRLSQIPNIQTQASSTEITTQAERDALPIGAKYTFNGKEYIKGRDNA